MKVKKAKNEKPEVSHLNKDFLDELNKFLEDRTTKTVKKTTKVEEVKKEPLPLRVGFSNFNHNGVLKITFN